MRFGFGFGLDLERLLVLGGLVSFRTREDGTSVSDSATRESRSWFEIPLILEVGFLNFGLLSFEPSLAECDLCLFP